MLTVPKYDRICGIIVQRYRNAHAEHRPWGCLENTQTDACRRYIITQDLTMK